MPWGTLRHFRRLGVLIATASLLGAAGRRRDHWRRTRCRLFDLELDAEVAEIRRRLEASRVDTHRHDLANALTAVDGASMILTQDALSATDRSTLATVLVSGLSRLRVLVLDASADDQVPLDQLIASLAAEPGWRNLVQIDVPPGLVVAVSPSELAEAIRHLMAHARRRDPSSAMTVRARPSGDCVELWVDDFGPCLSSRQRRRILDPNCRRSFGADRTGGVHVAARLARERGGEVRIEPRSDGGESFGISWPVSHG